MGRVCLFLLSRENGPSLKVGRDWCILKMGRVCKWAEIESGPRCLEIDKTEGIGQRLDVKKIRRPINALKWRLNVVFKWRAILTSTDIVVNQTISWRFFSCVHIILLMWRQLYVAVKRCNDVVFRLGRNSTFLALLLKTNLRFKPFVNKNCECTSNKKMI